MLDVPVAKRHRMRARARTSVQTAPRPVEPAEARAAVATERAERIRARRRGAPPGPGGSRAVAAPSSALERAAALERGYVVKDFRRLGLVILLVLILLVASGIVVDLILK